LSFSRNSSPEDKVDITEHIKKTSDAIREEQLKLDDQLLILLDSQMKLIAEESKVSQIKKDETDHSIYFEEWQMKS
jgi:hypothetical protein